MSELVERLQSHMGKADMGDVLRDCREASARIEQLEAIVLSYLTKEEMEATIRDALAPEQNK